MKKIARVLYNVSCVIGSLVGIWHFFAPYSNKWYSYIPNAPTEILQSINYINFCFSLMLSGISLLLIIVQKKLFDGSRELKAFYAFYTLIWLSRVIIQLIWPWPSNLQLWLGIAFSMEFIFTLVPMLYLIKGVPNMNK